MTPSTRRGGALAGLLLFLLAAAAFAHAMGVSYSSLELRDDRLIATLKMSGHDILALLGASPDAEAAAEIPLRSREVLLYVGNRYMLEADGQELTPAAGSKVSFTRDGPGWAEVVLVYPSPAAASTLRIRSTLLLEIDPQHAHLVSFHRPDGRIEELVLKLASKAELPLTDSATRLWPQLRRFIALGVEHIFLGYDHILFLLALLILAAGFLDLVKIVSSFTVAHTLTLILATLDVVRLPSRFVECVIALSICYVAIENFTIRDTSKRWRLTFAFGLIHGFGFSSVLREMGLPRSGLVACLLSFNAGVELGQLAIVSCMFPVLRALTRWRHHDRIVRIGGSAAILAAGLYWFFERAFGT